MQRRIAIVEDVPGVTRDRIYAEADWAGYHFTLVDTGGFVWEGDPLAQAVARQAQEAMAESDVIVLLLDGKTGATADDMEIANLLRRSGKPVVVAVNKVDSFAGSEELISDFFQLGLGEPVPLSAANGLNLGDLLDLIVSHLKKMPQDEEDEAVAVAIAGRPNVGKSSLLNL